MNRYPYILGCLLGTALGDAVGLRREGLSARRAQRMYGDPPFTPSLGYGLAMVSDDTEHTQLVTRALALSGLDPDRFEREFAHQLRCWLLAVPAGVGFATLRACIKLLIGFSPSNSGVLSAGNGPAMRSAMIGIVSRSESEMVEFVRRSTRMTHTDERAFEGSLIVAFAAGLTARGETQDPLTFLKKYIPVIQGEELRSRISAAIPLLEAGKTPQEYSQVMGWSKGVSGYVNETVPAAIYCWASSPTNFRECIEDAVRLGGDTDTVAAIAGAICGANLTNASLPQEWLSRLTEWPRNMTWMEQLSDSLASGNGNPPGMHWPTTFLRNIVFTTAVLSLGLRRLLPPY